MLPPQATPPSTPTYLLTGLPIYFSTYLLTNFLAYLLTYLLTYVLPPRVNPPPILSHLLVDLHTYPLTHLLIAYCRRERPRPLHSLSYLPVYLLTQSTTYLHSHALTVWLC